MCSFWDTETQDYYELRDHVEEVHFGWKHKCPLCNFKAEYLEDKKKHFLANHKCPLCNFESQHSQIIREHYVKKHECPIYEFSNEYYLEMQRKKETRNKQ